MCDCGYDFASASDISHNSQETSLSYRRRLRVGWMFVWRSIVLTIVGFLAGTLVGYFLRHVLGFGSVIRALLFLTVFVPLPLWCWKRLVLDVLLRKSFKDFSIVLARRNRATQTSSFSVKEAISLMWLLTWRPNLLGMIMGAVCGAIYGPPTGALRAAIVWFGIIQGALWGYPWAIKAMLRKQFSSFRLYAIQTARH